MKDATNDPRIIASWVDSWGEENINWALATGHGVLVVDVDPRHGGYESLAEIESEFGALLETFTVITGGGGLHLYYRTDHDVPNRTRVRPGIDFRSEGGYVLLPGSTHLSGSRYVVRDPSISMAPAPDVLSWRRTSTAGDSPVLEDQPLSEGTRNAGLHQRVERTWLLTGDPLATRATAHGVNRTLCDPPLSVADVEKIYSSVLSRSPLAPEQVEWAKAATQPPVRVRERAVLGGDFALDVPDHIEAVWGSGDDVLMAAGEGTMLAGPQGTGKSTLAQEIVYQRIGLRTESLLGYPVQPSDRRVLYAGMDRPRQIARSMRRGVQEADRQRLNEALTVWRGPLPFDPTRATTAFADFIEATCPGVGFVVIDSVKDLVPGISKDEIGAALNSSWQEVIARGVELLLLHHQRKAGQGAARDASLDGIYGSTWLTSGLGSVLILEGEPGDAEVVLHHAKQPAGVVGPLTVHHDHRTGASTLTEAPISLPELLLGAGSVGLTAHDVAEALYGGATESNLVKARRALAGLVSSRQAVKTVGHQHGGGREPDRYVASPEALWAAGQR